MTAEQPHGVLEYADDTDLSRCTLAAAVAARPACERLPFPALSDVCSGMDMRLQLASSAKRSAPAVSTGQRLPDRSTLEHAAMRAAIAAAVKRGAGNALDPAARVTAFSPIFCRQLHWPCTSAHAW